MAGGAISTESASEADSSDQRSQIRLAIKKLQIVFMLGNHICDPNKRMGLISVIFSMAKLIIWIVEVYWRGNESLTTNKVFQVDGHQLY